MYTQTTLNDACGAREHFVRGRRRDDDQFDICGIDTGHFNRRMRRGDAHIG